MKHVLDRWLAPVDRNRLHRPAMFATGLALAFSTIGGPAALAATDTPASTASPAATATAGTATAAAQGDAKQAAPKKEAQVGFGYQEQSTYYFCAPAATRIALSAQGHTPSQEELAKALGTTENGTDSAHETTRVLNQVNGNDFYHTVEIPGSAAEPAEMDQLQADAVRALSNGYPIVANIKGTAVDVDGKAHSYEGGHYLTVVGYRDEGRTVQLADPYDTSNGGTYWMSTISLANWIAERGYSA
ncbi:C39 family peptidase [Phytohabitans suffuscus]|nr:C39 family peptidase [Phytohabitans suffuscus]